MQDPDFKLWRYTWHHKPTGSTNTQLTPRAFSRRQFVGWLAALNASNPDAWQYVEGDRVAEFAKQSCENAACNA